MSFLVIPSIDIKNGKTVRVVQGIPEIKSKTYEDDPVKMARIWRSENAKMIHVVDFDGVSKHTRTNFKIIEEICNSVIIPVQFAGGIRTMEDVNAIMQCGIARLVVATMAIENKPLLIDILNKFGNTKIAVALDIIKDEVVIFNRKRKTGINYKDFVKDMDIIGVKRFIVTDVERNGMLGGPNINLVLEIAKMSNAKITVSGGIRNKDELIDLQNLQNYGIDSVIVGRALYENRFPCQKLWRIAESGIF